MTTKRTNLKAVPAASDKKVAILKLSDKTYRLGYDFNQICVAETESGRNLMPALADVRTVNAGQLPALLCAAMRAGNPDLKITVREVGALITVANLEIVLEAYAESIMLSIPKKETAPAA